VSEFAVMVREVPLEIATEKGGVLQAGFFLHDNGPRGPERLMDRLNDSESFLPLRTSEGVIQLWRKSSFHRIVCWEPLVELEEYRQVGVVKAPLRVFFPGGESLDGQVYLLMPSIRKRVSDLLNGPDCFFLMETESGVVILNKEGIDAVLPLDGGMG
jgi:hypothetical protein